jgi:CYTH domain-containing protein
MAKEIERKFLVASDSWRTHDTVSISIIQAYVAVGDDRNVRVRIIDGNSAQLTVKLGRHAVTRDEYEYGIPVEDAREMIAGAVGIVIEKTRFIVPYGGFTWEVDVFAGFYKGLVVAEVEMESEEDAPEIPDWIGREVTGDRRYSNMVMATEDLSAEHGHGVSNQAQ